MRNEEYRQLLLQKKKLDSDRRDLAAKLAEQRKEIHQLKASPSPQAICQPPVTSCHTGLHAANQKLQIDYDSYFMWSKKHHLVANACLLPCRWSALTSEHALHKLP